MFRHKKEDKREIDSRLKDIVECSECACILQRSNAQTVVVNGYSNYFYCQAHKRLVSRESAINGINGKYIIMSGTEYQNLCDYLISNETFNILTENGTAIILGLEIILDERKILRLTPSKDHA